MRVWRRAFPPLALLAVTQAGSLADVLLTPSCGFAGVLVGGYNPHQGDHQMPTRIVLVMMCALLVLGMLTCAASQAANLRIDGNWWLKQSTDTKAGFVLGFQSGTMAQQVICIGTLEDKKHPACQDFGSVPHATIGQIVDGITQFYQDARNRTILAFHADWIVAASNRGDPAIQEQIEQWRRTDVDLD
jgi:hypothetical protein